MKQIVVGLHGLPNVGKDLLGDYLSLAHGFTKIAFADLLYQQVADAWGVPVGALQDRVWKDRETSMMAFMHCRDYAFHTWVLNKTNHEAGHNCLPDDRSPRELLCAYSDFIKYKTGNLAFYVDHVSSVIRENEDKHFVVTDVRYDREAEFIAKLGRSCILEIVKPGNVNNAPGNHESAKGINDIYINSTIVNSGTKIGLFGVAEWAIGQCVEDFEANDREYRRRIKAIRGHSSFRNPARYQKD